VPAHQVVLGKRVVAGDLVAQVLRQVRLQPGAHLVAESELFGGVVEVHGHSRDKESGAEKSTPHPRLKRRFAPIAAAGYRMVTPPSATMHCPVTNAAASEARKTAIPPMSRGSPRRRRGVAASRSVRRFSSSQSARANSVRTRPGAIAFTRTFFGPHSAARLRTRWWPAAFDMP